MIPASISMPPVLFVLRPDVGPEERCYTATVEGRFIGFAQGYKDGSVGVWRKRGQVAVLTKDWTAASTWLSNP